MTDTTALRQMPFLDLAAQNAALKLPIYPEFSNPEQERVVAALERASQLMQDHN